MKRYTVAQARQQFAEVLNAAERGDPVVIERRGVRFVIEAQQRRRRPSARRKSIIQHLDPAVAAGEWTWGWKADGLRFKSRPRAR
jgi:antitoxin (DNA-binding transcriptional repressor) of toxin-antitoxin stability system